ncbi:DNA-directed DNA polymerase [Malassezia sp. CBS 17886]|nr:DNA-directed DNA polymerase [Malassezia sp. CBS 17886]
MSDPQRHGQAVSAGNGAVCPAREAVVPTFRHLFSTSFDTNNPLRIIAHCDVDAAYAQFEAARLGLDCSTVPIGVLQWRSLIAVNYVARAKGVNRFNCTLDEAMERCPGLRLIHVASYGPGDVEPKYYPLPSSKTHKISLDLYRRESKKIMDIFRRRLANKEQAVGEFLGYDMKPIIPDGWVPRQLALDEERVDEGILLEKASIDESFFDLSLYVRKQLLHQYPFLDFREALARMSPDAREKALDAELPRPPLAVRDELPHAAWVHLGAWLPSDDDPERVDEAEISWVDVAHAIAAERMIAVRKHVLERLGYTTSAGVAGNKTLAKTVLLPRHALSFLAPMHFQKIRFLGGKLGAEVAQSWNHSTVTELWDVSREEMRVRLGAGGLWLYDLIRGIDRSEVSKRIQSRSMMSAKNFGS